MAIKEIRTPVGTDIVDTSGYTWQIAGIEIDNPSGSWLRITGIDQYVPPYTIGWAFPISPSQMSISILFVDSPSGTPSQLSGSPVTVRLHSIPIPANPGFPSGASEFQQGGIGNKTYAFNVIVINETYQVAATSINFPNNIRAVVLNWRVAATISANAVSEFQVLRTMATVTIVDGFGADLFPPAVISPERPDAGSLPPTGRVLQSGSPIQIGGMTAPGGGEVQVTTYLEYYPVVES